MNEDVKAHFIATEPVESSQIIERLIAPETESTFKASYGWVRRFMKRYNLVLRRISGSGRAFKSDTAQVVTEYLRSVREIIATEQFEDFEIINFDESSFYMDSVGNYSVATKGSRKVYARTTGKEKVRLSCLMTSTASGHKFPILCVVPRKKRIPVLEDDPNIIIIYETKGNQSLKN